MLKLKQFKLVKRTSATTFQHTFFRVIAIIVAFLISSILIIIAKANPIEAFENLLTYPFSYTSGTIEVIKLATILCVISLGITFAFKMRFWNIGAEGQILLGAIGATFIAMKFPTLSPFLLLPLMLAASFVAGAFWGLIPAVFKAKFGTNETLFTLMMNYIALYAVKALESGWWKDPNSFQDTIAPLPPNSRIPSLFSDISWQSLNVGFLIAIMLTIIVYYYLNHTKSGYEISVVGESESTARYAGMNVSKIIIKTMILSAGICGIAGFIQVAGNNSTLSSGIASGIGFTAIITTWLAQLNVFVIPLVTFLFAVITIGKDGLSVLDIPVAAATAIQAIVLFCILGSEFFLRYKIQRFRKEKSVAPSKPVSEPGGAK